MEHSIFRYFVEAVVGFGVCSHCSIAVWKQTDSPSELIDRLKEPEYQFPPES
jgi:hypothetical protein